ncbi:flagellar biosynthesis anti-sigma factor FlgM [Brevibacillus fluminis]|uniref:flagellar biosynthesis anti-sigma factor FlgM n=1 Tax=Brevibacillus fluminis TaxID=511487 RepID=UPI003F8B9C49
MRINETNRTGMINAYNNTAKAAASKEGKHKMGKDEVQISSEALEMLRMGEDTEETPQVRKQRVQSIKQAIEDGTYQVPTEKVAEKFLSFWKKP